MSTTLADPDLIEVTSLEEMFAQDLACEYTSCSKTAEWRVVATPCSHGVHLCALHKLREIARFKMDFPNTYCHVDHTTRVTELTPERL